MTALPLSHVSFDGRIWESPLLQAAKENNLSAIRKLLTDGTCDIYQRGKRRLRAKRSSAEGKSLLLPAE